MLSPAWHRTLLGWRRLFFPCLLVPGRIWVRTALIHLTLTLFVLPFAVKRVLSRRRLPALPTQALFIGRTHLGDFLMSVPALELFKTSLPACRVSVILQGQYQTSLELEKVLDETMEGPAPTLSFLKQVRAWIAFFKTHSFDAILFHRITRPDFPALVAAFLCDIPYRMGGADKGTQALLTHAYFPTRRERIARYHLHLVAAFLSLSQSDPAKPLHWPILHRPQPPATRYDVLIAPYAQHSKTWLDVAWRAVLQELHQRSLSIALITSADHGGEAATLLEGQPFVTNLAGQTSLPELFDLVAAARAVITVDTGTRHIAAALGTPCVVLGHGREHRDLMGAYVATERYLVHDVPCAPCGAEPCPLGHLRCIRDLSVEDVLKAIRGILP